ncbi:MAG: DUF1501 domain-containing protein [Pirellulales bacterium]
MRVPLTVRDQDALNRRVFLRGAGGVGSMALATLLPGSAAAATVSSAAATVPASPAFPSFPPRAKRIIYLFQAGGPAQLDLFDPKPGLAAHRGQDLPASVRMGQRLTTMTSGQSTFPVAPSIFSFRKHGQSGLDFSELVPNIARHADRWCMIRSMVTEQINHDPAVTFVQTGHQLAGRPSIGAWVNYGLGSENSDLPAYIALTSFGSSGATQPLSDRLWGSGFLPTRFQGVKFRNTGDPVLYLTDPTGVSRAARRTTLDQIAELNAVRSDLLGDPEILARTGQYEMAFRMQTSVPEIVDFSSEPKHVLDAYGPGVAKPGTYAFNCLLARRLSERGVRFVQLFHMGWDQHGGLPNGIRNQCKDTDQATGALLDDLARRGLLDETLVVWGGEFGRTVYSQGTLTETNYGRDHHPRCFTTLLAGAGIKGGTIWGATDDFSYNIATPDRAVHVHDLNATILHLMGIDHERLTYRYQGRDFRLTDVHGHVVKGVLT